jgi:hypothetical protein
MDAKPGGAALNPAFLLNLNQSVSIAHKGTPGASGMPTYGTATAYACRITPKDVWSVNHDGVTVVNHAVMIILPDNCGILSTDQLTLPSGEKRPVIELSSIYDQFGALDHYEVIC